jgi:hypothetical protein
MNAKVGMSRKIRRIAVIASLVYLRNLSIASGRNEL